jgi:hypothetical protein
MKHRAVVSALTLCTGTLARLLTKSRNSHLRERHGNMHCIMI